jgi:hypothetical protein
MGPISRTVRRAAAQARRDLRTDPYLAPILLVAFVCCAFWVWHRVPNFATWDERDRILDPLVAYASVLEDPSLDALREGVAWGREPFGATFYLYALAVGPVVVAAVLLGEGASVAALAFPDPTYGYVAAWQSTPAWLWTGVITLARLVNVVLAVGSVYLTYRLGVALRDRTTGRLAAALTALTFGLAILAHEAGEDVPALFAVLLALYLAVRYVQTGSTARFLQASAAGGLAVGLKLTAAPIVPLIGLAFVLRARRAGLSWPRGYWQPRLLLAGMATGAVVVLCSFPTLLVGHVDPVLERLWGHSRLRYLDRVGPAAPTWWWFLRGYLSAFGLPLTVAAAVGVFASAAALRADALDVDRDAVVLVVAGLVGFVLLFAGWDGFRMHHLLPTMPLAVLLLAAVLVRSLEGWPTVARPAVAALLVSTALFTGVGVAGYASEPRADATAWLDERAPANATLETYHHGFDESAVPHGMAVSHRWGPESPDERVVACPQYVQLTYQNLLYLRDVAAEHRSGYLYGNVSRRAAYVRDLLSGEYAYEIVAQFGERPPNYVPQRPTPGSLVETLTLGIHPRTDFYGDEQELGPSQYVVILERTGPCDRDVPEW